MQKSTFLLEREFAEKGCDFVIGVDEVGRGPLCGPVVACAVALRNFKFSILNFQSNSNDKIFNDSMWGLVRDSKKLSEKQREKVFDFIQENFHVGIGLCDEKTIDRINILEATYLAAKKAISDVARKIDQDTRNNNQTNSKIQNSGFRLGGRNDNNIIILFDGNKIIPNLSMEQRAVVGGDKIVKSISAASIIAKVTRDRLMTEMHKKYPHYGFDKHKGYGTKLHMDALAKHGPCEIHRQSFAPVKKNLNIDNEH